MAAVSGNHLGGKICEIFGLSRVMSLSLTCNLNEAATIHAEIATDKIQGDELVTLLKKYELHEVQSRDWLDDRADEIKSEIEDMTIRAMEHIFGYPLYSFGQR